MFGKLLITGAVTAAFALTVTDAAAQPRGPCPHLHNITDCNNYPTGECFWDNTDFRCETRDPGHDPICANYDFNGCVADSRCFWDNTDVRCERR